jgi:hypothetical protein
MKYQLDATLQYFISCMSESQHVVRPSRGDDQPLQPVTPPDAACAAKLCNLLMMGGSAPETC